MIAAIINTLINKSDPTTNLQDLLAQETIENNLYNYASNVVIVPLSCCCRQLYVLLLQTLIAAQNFPIGVDQ